MRDSRSVQRTIDASPAAVFTLLADPARHVELDGSGTLCGLVAGGPITAVGQRFRMAMDRPGRADYRSDNIVTRYEPDTALGWATTDVDLGHLGYTWTFLLVPDPAGGTVVTHVYDWSDVTDPALRSRFPQVGEHEMAATLDRLATAVTGR